MSDLFKNHPVVPVIVIEDAQKAIPIAEALVAGGVRIIEFTFRTKAAAEAVKRVRENIPQMLVGAGTILTPDQARQAIDSGTQFALAPGVDAEIVDIFNAAGIPFIPGVATPSDISLALKLGCLHQKFFPAETLGGATALKNMSAPFLSTGVKFCPTGGVNKGNMAEYLAMPQVFTVGGTWLAKADEIESGDWAAITAKAAEAVKIGESLA